MRRLSLLAIPLVILSGCANLTGSVTPGELEEQRQATRTPAQIQENDPVTLNGLSIEGRFVGVDGEWMRVFEYESEEAAIADQGKISADGAMIDGNAVTWGGPVHFFRSGRVIVVYLGKTDSILKKLSESGPQFAGN